MIIKKRFILIYLILIIIFFIMGWVLRGSRIENLKCASSPLRLSGFEFVKPLLVCDTNTQKDYSDLKILETKLKNIINTKKEIDDKIIASVYFQDFKTDGRIDVNENEKFNSASIGKVAIMIAFYRLAESDPYLLAKQIKYTGGIDTNSKQAIQSKNYIVTGETYTVEELIQRMIRYSDNNAMYLLVSLLNASTIKSLYEDLQISIPFDIEHPENFDFITTRDISYFFRILYNSTYLMNDFSERALQFLSETDYNDGLVAGVPKNIIISHKYGSRSIEQGNNIIEIQFHDCGIVYHPRNPYLLCVMTKNFTDIPSAENLIKEISTAVYQYQDSR